MSITPHLKQSIISHLKQYALPNLPYVVVFIAAWKISGEFPWITYPDFLVGLAAAIAIRIAVYIKGKNAKKFRKNTEYGSAVWGTAKNAKFYADPNPDNNIILTQTEWTMLHLFRQKSLDLIK